MQNPPKTVKTSKHRNLTTRVGLKSQKDDFDNTRSTHQTNIHQNMMNAPQNEDIVVKSSVKVLSFKNFEQQTTFSDHKFSSYERVEEQLERTLNAILGKDECFKSSSSGYLTPILVARIHTKSELMSEILDIKASKTLQNPNLLRELLETEQEFLSFNQNCSLLHSVVLNLAEDPERDDGTKPIIKEDLNLKSPQTFNLCELQIDDCGAKHSLKNESWNYLEELKLRPNSLSEDLTIEDLDQAWTHFKRTLLWNCNADKPAIKYLQFNKLLNSYPTTGYSVNREEKVKKQDTKLSREVKKNSITELKEVPPALIMQSLKPDKRIFHDLNNLGNEISRETYWLLRGGLPENQGTSPENRDLLIKLEQYREKVLSKNNDERELNLYIEPLIRSELELKDDSHIYKRSNRHLTLGTEPLDPLKDLRKQFLTSDKTVSSQVLLLTGQAGGGKSVFCRRLQRDLLSAWSSSFTQEIDDNLWFPIYIDCSLMKEFEANSITIILQNELSLREEEIKTLQSSEAYSTTLPNILIILDGCDIAVHKLLEELLLSDFGSEKCNISSIIGAERYKTVKILITCREESLQGIKRRELLFVPIQHEESLHRSNSSKLFLQRRIAPFSDEQITRYLIKCCFYGLLQTSQITSISKALNLAHLSEPSSDLLPSSSWITVKNFESIIDSYRFREIARTPFMLRVMVEVLPSIAAETLSEENLLQTKAFTNYYFIEQFINRVIYLNAQMKSAASIKTEGKRYANKLEENKVLKPLVTQIRQQLQSLALKLSGYSLNSSYIKAPESELDFSILELNSLVKWDNNFSTLRFRDSLVMEYLVAEQFKEELAGLSAAYLTKDKSVIQKEILLNQRLLKLRATAPTMIVQILCDAVENKEISTDLLYNLVYLSRQNQKISDSPIQMRAEKEELQIKDGEQEESKHNIVEAAQQQSKKIITEKRLNDNITKENYLQSHFEIAAANAITILNMTGFDFDHRDLSNICIKGANLSYGMFEGTNFANARLQRVIFTGAWLKDANLQRANLQGVDFGEDSDLKIWDDFIAGISYSRNGKYLAVEVYDQTMLYENLGSRYSSFKKINNFPRIFSTIARCCPFSNDGKQIATILDNQINIWDIESGQLRKKFDTGFKTVLGISPDMGYAAFRENQNIHVYSIKRDSWMHILSMSDSDKLISCDANFNQPNFFVLGIKNRGILFYDYGTGKCLLKQSPKNIGFFKCNSNGNQIASKVSRNFIRISDIVRGHAIKALKYQDETDEYKGEGPNINSLKFGEDLLLYDHHNFIYILDIVSAKIVKRDISDIELKSAMYSLHPRGELIAAKKNKNTITFNNFYQDDSVVYKERANHRGLNLEGVIANLSVELSEENIGVFIRKGEYYPFDKSTLQVLFSSSLSETMNIVEIKLVYSNLTSLHVKIIENYHQLNDLKRLNLSRNKLSDKGGELIGCNKSWVNLEELMLRETGIGDKSAVSLGSNYTWKNLKKLDLSQNNIGNEGAISIAGNDVWENLTALNLSSNSIGTQGIVPIITNKTWIRLQNLELIHNPSELEEKDLLQTIKNIPSTKLEKLTLSGVQLDRELLQIIKYSVPESVNEILFGEKRYGKNVLRIIANNETWTGLKKLDLSYNGITDDVGAEILSNSLWVEIEEINLSWNHLGSKSGKALVENKTWRKLKVLILNNNNLEEKSISLIAENNSWKYLQNLDLRSNKIGDEGAAALSKNVLWITLASLDLRGNNIGDKGAAALSKNVSWTTLTSLDLGENKIGDEGAAALSKNVSWTTLTSLNLYYNNIRVEGAAALSKNVSWINLTSLNLSMDNIGDEGAAALSKNVSWTTLSSLNLYYNFIGAEAAAALSKNVSWINLTSLNLARNNIGDKGAAALSKNVSWTSLTSLDLGENKIGDEGAAALSKNVS